KRPFFMEGLGLFNLAGVGNDSNMNKAVHTRHIIDPIAGAKLTGSAGKSTFALLSAGDQSVGGDRTRMFTIGRAVRNLAPAQYAGLIATDTELLSEHNRVAGGDVALRHGDHVDYSGLLLASHSSTLTGQTTHGLAGQANYGYNS